MKTVIRFSICLFIITIVGFANAGQNDRCWVYLREPSMSPEQLQTALQQAKSTLTPRCLTRRAKVRGADALVDEFDIPLNQAILDSIRARGFEIVVQSKWLRAVSVRGSYGDAKILETLSFVKKVEQLPKKQPETFNEFGSLPNPGTHLPSHHLPIKNSAPTVMWDSVDYGYSYYQLKFMNVFPAHNRGYTGRGVLLGMNDAGFPRLCRGYPPDDSTSYHVAFDSLHIVATHDFLHGDSIVSDASNSGHGTNTLSCIAGYKDSLFIGVAPHVWVTLAETEQAAGSDFTAEVDYWIAALEWHERYGVDIVSSSVSWVAWYPYNLRNGASAPSQAAAHAASLGMLVVNSAGNHGADAEPHISVPSDADSMLCAGSVNSDSSYSYFSSRGPTYDGRIKPELTTLGVSVGVADAGSTTRILPASGTSFSAPSLAGACAVVLSANLNLTPMQILHVMKRSADRWNNPDTLYGWGIPNVDVAVDSAIALIDTTQQTAPDYRPIPEQYVIRAFPNPFNPSITLYFAPTHNARAILVYDELGRLVDTINIGGGASRASFIGTRLPSGNYFLRFANSAATKVSLIR